MLPPLFTLFHTPQLRIVKTSGLVENCRRICISHASHILTPMDRWLAQIGLKGRALQIATKACDDNLVDDLSALRALVDHKEQFKDVFPQGFLQVAILNALASDEHKEVKEKQAVTEIRNESTASVNQPSGSNVVALPAGKR